MSEPWSVLITGPASGLERWAKAAEQVGWRAETLPLVTIEETGNEVLSADADLPDWVAITSANALPALARAALARPALSQQPLVCVGQATAERAMELGLPEPRLPAPGAQNAAGLAATLLEHATPGERVLWPRGDRSRDFGQRLEQAGLLVQDPVVYHTTLLPLEREPPSTDAVFFASPSAVCAWRAEERTALPAAIAMGWTTYDALEPLAERFSMILPLATPSLASFQDCLQSFIPSE